MIAILQVGIKKKLETNRRLWNRKGFLITPAAHQYYRGYNVALEEVLQELDKIYETVKEEI